MDSQFPIKIRMINMRVHPVSQMYARITIPSWEKFGYSVKRFEAVTPKDLYKKHKLEFADKGNRDFTHTEMAVWYSHFELWCESVRENTKMIIVEHDSKLVKELPDLTAEGHKFLSFINRDFGRAKGKDMAPGSGYYITPLVAQRLVSQAVSSKIVENSDGFLARHLNGKRQKTKLDWDYIEQINIDGLNTIDHKNPDRNYVGLDYEEIDIPSLHGQKI